MEMSDRESISSKAILIKNLQRESLMQCLHDIQSPLSGTSGYLELMQICINGDKDLFKIARYRNKIQVGLQELEDILLQISYLYKGDSVGGESTVVEFDLNWLIKEIASNVSALAQKREQKIVFDNQIQNVHVHTDMIVLKLLLYNLMIAVLKAAVKGENVEIGLELNDETVAVQMRINELIRPLSEVIYPFVDSEALPETANPEKSKRFGLQAIHLLEGSIQTESFGERGTQFSLILPK